MSLDFYINGEACEHCSRQPEMLYENNITHNMVRMAQEAGVYSVLWHPVEDGNYTTANEIISTLEGGIERLKAKPDYFRQFNPENGWGSYEGLLEFCEEVLAACRKYPKGKLHTSC